MTLGPPGARDAMELRTFASEISAIKAAAGRLNVALAEASPRPILFLSAGGSALALVQELADTVLGPHVTIGVSDERFSTDPKINNFAQLAATAFYQRAQKCKVSWIDTSVQPEETCQALATRFDSALKRWRAEHPDGAILITQGIGEDGHTAGIMPFPENPMQFTELFENPQRWAVDYDATAKKNPHPQRVTATLTFLRSQVDESIVYAAGEEKRGALKRVVAAAGELVYTPARVLREMRSVTVFTTISGLRAE